MSHLLYKIGGFAARRAWAVIGIWALLLAGFGGAYAAFKGEMSSAITIPGTEAQQVQEDLSDIFGIDTSAASGTVILQTEDGSAFTEAQKVAVADAVARAGEQKKVDSVMDPFDVATQLADGESQIDEARGELASGQTQVDEGQAELDATRQQFENGEAPQAAWDELNAGQAEIDANRPAVDEGLAALDTAQRELDASRAQVEAGQAQLDQARAGLEASGAPAEAYAELDAQQAELDAARAQVDAGQAEIDANRATAEAGAAELDAAQAQVDEARAQLENFEPTQEMWDELNAGQADIDAARTELATGASTLERQAALLDMTKAASVISEDGSTALVSVTFTEKMGSVENDTLVAVKDQFNGLSDLGLTVTYDQNLQDPEVHLNVTAELVGIAIAFIVLFLMLGTLIAAGLPIIMALVGVGASALGVLALSGTFEMNSMTPTLGTMLGLAVGIDYTLFILNRHRNNLAQGMDIKTSIALATGTSGGAVVFAGITVIIALLGLNVVGIPFLAVMGNAGAFAIALAVAVSVTLSPAVMSLLGWRIISKKRRATLQERAARAAAGDSDDVEARAEAHAAAEAHEEKRSGWLKATLTQPLATVVAAVLALAAVALPVADMRLGLPDGSSETPDSAAYISYNLIADNFGEGQNGTMVAAAYLPEGTTKEQAEELQVEVGQKLKEQQDVDAVIPAEIAKDNSALLYQVVPAEGPNAESTAHLVHTLRDLTLSTSSGDVHFGITGATAMGVDIAQNLADVLPLYIALVMGLSLLVLVLVFRSILVPITATVGFLFSLLAALGATTAVFQWGWLRDVFGVSTPGPLLAFLPILAVGILFGLAMDYQLFMVSGMREAYSHGRGAKTSVVVGFNHGAKVVTAAALIMAGVFIGFVFSGDPMIASIGFVLAAGVLFDAFVVRMTLIPALMYLLGERAWWIPAWLDKILPDLDVEGTKLESEIQKAKGL